MNEKNRGIFSMISLIISSIFFFISLVVFAFQINSDVASLCTTLGILFVGIYRVLAKFKLGYIAVILALIAIILNLVF
ncbi:hypothetical protein G5S33_00038 [Staphylococcus cohnii subsp. cohnii]|uniref:hypothetical protein n=1 Tax=Staphylococcus cohnii TaxID=29382 RepID=UPI001602F18C|nr:hypothetical protein [Staphylococcus cohnii]MBB2506649.1 hypothetical protein [Staphylococcus cohnii subsp. barensis]